MKTNVCWTLKLSWTVLILSAFLYFSYTGGPLVGLINGNIWLTSGSLESFKAVVYGLLFSIFLIGIGLALIDWADKGHI